MIAGLERTQQPSNENNIDPQIGMGWRKGLESADPQSLLSMWLCSKTLSNPGRPALYQEMGSNICGSVAIVWKE